MKPNWVLSEDQCKIRFRNVNKEKEKLKEKAKGIKVETEELHRVDYPGDDVILIKNEVKSAVTTSKSQNVFLTIKTFQLFPIHFLTINV